MINQLLHLARPHMMPLGLSLVCRILNQLGTIAILVVAGQYAQHLFLEQPVSIWPQLLWPLLWIGIGKAICRYIEQLSGHNAAFRIQEDLRNQVYWRLEQQAPDNIHDLSTGDLTARVVSDIERIEVFYAHTIVPVLSALVVSLLVTAYGYWLVGSVAIVLCLLLLIVGGVLPTWHLNRSSKLGQEIRSQFGLLNTLLTDVVSGFNEIQNWSAMAFFQRKVSKQGRVLQRLHNALAVRNGIKDALTDLSIGSGFVAMIVLAWWQGESLSLTALCLYAGAFGPVLALTRTFEDLPQTFPACRRVLAILEAEPSAELSESNSVPAAIHSDALLSVEDLSHRYGATTDWLFEDLSLALSAGTHLVIQGQSGSGKTSLLRYLAGIYLSDTSPLRFKGEAITRLNREAAWQQISYVPQQSVIFPASLRYNLSLGGHYSDEKLMQALRLVCLEPMYCALADGLDTELGLNGTRLSGGEAQRVALARAWLRDTPVYLLDEAFSALDKQTERVIRQRLSQDWQNKLVVEVAHQPQGLNPQCLRWLMKEGQLTALS
ncbi:ABC transporter ATP-binding protein/permease [Vibrio sp. J1-1]|uniref:amino acid ABC transporter ATP-binding/permease protein n=1 Tax=Vibrio sp. J1-1 TaxID=2912251 RepID=UPI001F1CFC45|nr:ABC transporter ATP-binding protein [Vibrio sp. J1-1]MCF7482193.1 ABC transporter ATP-binding protein/permease [Vibrio sp. J1-1]